MSFLFHTFLPNDTGLGYTLSTATKEVPVPVTADVAAEEEAKGV